MGNINGREILRSIIENFSTEKFIHFFRNKNTSFKPLQVAISNYNDGDFTSGEKIGEINFQDNNLIVCSFQVLKELTERSGKKKQYELGKRILKDTNQDAGIFIFYDRSGNFRFSLIYTEYSGTRRKFSLFKRFTYFVSKEKTNKTFLQQIGQGDFSSLEKIKEAFSVEPVTRQFYQEIANWYFWAIKNVRFPKGAEELPNGRNIAVIRLITRIIFIWFMKVRNLIPDELFDEKSLKNILKNFDPYSKNSSSFYLAILQNLFFATLNTKQEERRFRSRERGYKGYNTDFGNHNVYRYEDLFINSEEAIKKYFLPIPFLNGGLFECLDYKSKNKEERKYVDGFTDTKENQPFFPNYLFFAEMDYADLSEDYNDPKYKKTEVKGLIKILQQYNFTIDENEPDDVEVALDPELLGNVFENLLASYNPETATTARKATGSYYTPREIVDYMVDESLKEYFKTNIPDIDEENLNKLFSKEDYQNPFDENTTSKLINLIDSLRIVDPAVGSGAFPMRILNRLVFLLHKLDPDNSKWEATQIEGIKKSVKDPVLQKELIEQIKKRFKEKNPDYGRKLYLIEKCIYGVDIQQIAVEIAKLRFFISLLVDETIDSNEENYGIEPLPNLDFKIMQGNSLISTFYNIDFKQNSTPTGELPLDFEPRYKQLISEFEWLKSQYQSEPDVSKKQDLRKKIDEKIIEIFEEKLKQKFSELRRIEEKANSIPQEEQREKYIKEEKKKLSKKLGFDIDKAKEELIAYTDGRKDKNFFLWDIYFAEVFTEKNGFDIVIGNPPYIQLQNAYNREIKYADLYEDQNYQTFDRTGDIYCLFYEKGIQLLRRKGILAYITSNKWMRANYGRKLRKFFSSLNPKLLIDLGPNVFKCNNPNGPTVDTCILILEKYDNQNNLFGADLSSEVAKNCKETLANLKNLVESKKIFINNLSEDAWTIATDSELKLKHKIERIGKPLKDWDVKIYFGIKTGFNEAFIIDTETRNRILANCRSEQERKRTEEIIKPVLRGRDIEKYYYKWAGLWVIIIPAGWTNKHRGRENPEEFFKKTFPALYKHFMNFSNVKTRGKGLFDRDDQGDYWWELRPCDYYPEFEKEKIVWQEIVREPSFAYDNTGIYVEATGFLMTGRNLKYLLGLLNSKPVAFFFKTFYAGGGLGEDGYRYKKAFLEQLPIPPITPQNQPLTDQIVQIVDQILSAKKQNPEADTSKLEKEIDELVYKLYNLNEEEIKIIEGNI
jgi:adenine-specific DNA-methyltransferase